MHWANLFIAAILIIGGIFTIQQRDTYARYDLGLLRWFYPELAKDKALIVRKQKNGRIFYIAFGAGCILLGVIVLIGHKF